MQELFPLKKQPIWSYLFSRSSWRACWKVLGFMAACPFGTKPSVGPGRVTESELKALLLSLLAWELILSPPVTHCPSLIPPRMKCLQPTTVAYVFRAKALQCHINSQLITADKLQSWDLDLGVGKQRRWKRLKKYLQRAVKICKRGEIKLEGRRRLLHLIDKEDIWQKTKERW